MTGEFKDRDLLGTLREAQSELARCDAPALQQIAEHWAGLMNRPDKGLEEECAKSQREELRELESFAHLLEHTRKTLMVLRQFGGSSGLRVEYAERLGVSY